MIENDNWCVYSHTNKINGKKYIGISQNPYSRWGSHGHRYAKQRFGRAIKKYGWDNFYHEILYNGLAEQDACSKEIELINLYKTCDPKYGYNVLPGGDVGNLSQNGFSNSNSKSVYQYTLQGEYVACFHSVSDATKVYGTGISGCINGRSKTSSGFQWFDTYMGNKVAPVKSRVEAIVESQIKPVYQYSLDGKFLNRFDSIKEASEYNNIERTSITNCVNGKQKYGNGYIWFGKYMGESVHGVSKYKSGAKTIYQYTLDGHYITSYKSKREAGRAIGKKVNVKRNSDISISHGYKWSYKYYPSLIEAS